jgi:soluble lytic murein transglycosylase-like protein
VIVKSVATKFTLALLLAASFLPCLTKSAQAAEHLTLRNGFEMDCARREVLEGGRLRLFLVPTSAGIAVVDSSYIDVAQDAVLRAEAIPDLVPTAISVATTGAKQANKASTEPTKTEMHTMLARAGGQHNIDEDLLAALVKAESGGRTFAVSRTGARGLMQLMPGTASAMGVNDAFRPEQNIAGGTAYLDWLLMRYHDDATLALAAYNAGPGAVDKYHGVPPYRETRAYVARVIGEFNRRKLAARAAANQVAGLR